MPRLAFLSTLLWLALPAHAQEAPRLAIVGLHQAGLDEAAQEAAIARIAEAVDVTGKADGLETQDVVKAITGREEVILAEALLANGRQDLVNGKNLYNQAQTDKAISALQSAVEDLSVAVRATNSVKELWEAWIYLGTAHMQAGNQDVANSCFGAAAALNPDRNPNPALFPPDMTAAFETQRKLLAAAAVSFQITASADATLFLDGREIGKAPASVQGVYPGMHHVVAKGNGTYGYNLVRIEQTADNTAPNVELTLGAPVIGTAAESPYLRNRQIAGLYRALGTHVNNVDLLLIAGVENTEMQLQLYSPRADAFSVPVSFALTDSAGEAAADNIPTLMDLVSPSGKILQTQPLALSVGLDANGHLAALLMDPRKVQSVSPQPGPGGSPTGPVVKKKKSPVVPIIVSVLVAGAAGTGGYFTYNALKSDEPKFGGSVVIGPLSR